MGFFGKLFGLESSSTQATVAAPATQPTPMSSASSVFSSSGIAPARGGNWFNGAGKKNAVLQQRTVYSRKGTPLPLKASDVRSSGGEGTVYTMPENDRVLIKIYHDGIVSDPRKMSELRARIEDMISYDLSRNHCLAWPRLAALDAPQGKMIGFAMNKCEGRSFYSLGGGPSAVQQTFPGWDRLQLAQTAQDFVSKLEQLAKHGIYINDFNPNNFLVNERCEVSFIDCDSFQVPRRNGSVPHITRTFFGAYTAPELLRDPSLLARPRDIHQVEFGAAMIVFHLLMCGLHPYSYCNRGRRSACGSPEENLRNGHCPLGIGTNCRLPYGPNNMWYNLWSWLTGELKGCFIRTFRDGHGDPDRRASLGELKAALGQLIFEMNRPAGRDGRDYAAARRSLTPNRAKPRGDKTPRSSSGAFTSICF